MTFPPQGYREPPVHPRPPAFPPAAYRPPAYPTAYLPPPGWPTPEPAIYRSQAAPPPATGTNGFAIASMVLGILGGILLSVIFGLIALSQIRRTGERGRGLAITGLAASGAWLALLGIVIGAGVVGAMLSDPAADTVAASAAGLGTGTCVNNLHGDPVPVRCGVPHEGEVYAVFDLPKGRWPGLASVKAQAESRCTVELGLYVPDPDRADELDFTYLYPPRGAWPKVRTVTCIGFDPAGSLTGSIRG